jgi:hypothetical protein
MADELKRNEEIEFDAPVAEMSADRSAVIELDPDLVNRLVTSTKDEDPQFPIIRIEEGLSNNGFDWKPDILHSVAEQVNSEQPVGYMGHIRPEDDRWAFPEPITVWLRGRVTEEPTRDKKKTAGTFVKALYVKGYMLPIEKVRTMLATGVLRTTSWRGKSDVRYLKGGIRQPTRFKLESIDWSRPGKNAMTAELVTVTAEQTGRREDVEGTEIAKLTLSDLTTHNPNLVELIKREAASELRVKVAEMEGEVEGAQTNATLLEKLRELLGIDKDADIVEATTTLISKLNGVSTESAKSLVRKVLSAKVKDEKALDGILRLVNVAEMEKVTEGITDEDEAKKAVGAALDKQMNEDEPLRVLVAEMDSGARPPLTQRRTSPAERTSGRDRQSRGMVRGTKKL